MRNPDAADLSLTARPGHLRLVGSPVTLDEVASPSLVVRRQQHFRVRCRAALDFSPRAPNEEAGLTVRANESFRYDLAVRLGASGREVVLHSRIAGASTTIARAPLPDGVVTLEVVADETSYEFKLTAGEIDAAGQAAGAAAVRRGNRQTRAPPLHGRVLRPVRHRQRQARDRAGGLRLVRVRAVTRGDQRLRCASR